VIAGIGRQIGIGKESDVYVAIRPSETKADGTSVAGSSAAGLAPEVELGEELEPGVPVAAKFHRLGRTSFRDVKSKRDYLGHRTSKGSWLYLSRLAALKEFAYMRALHEHGFPVPTPVGVSRHVVIMELVPG
jgi:RIO kinase 2